MKSMNIEITCTYTAVAESFVRIIYVIKKPMSAQFLLKCCWVHKNSAVMCTKILFIYSAHFLLFEHLLLNLCINV